jgi:hypothetical protein
MVEKAIFAFYSPIMLVCQNAGAPSRLLIWKAVGTVST